MVFNSFLKRMFFFGKNTPEEKLCRGIWSSFVKFFNTVMQFCFVHPHKTKIGRVVFLQTLVAADTEEHRVLLRTCTEIKVGLQIQKREGFCPHSEVLVHQKIVSTQRFSLLFLWATPLLFLGEISFCFLSLDFKFKKNLEAEQSLSQICWCWESCDQQLMHEVLDDSRSTKKIYE